MANCLECTNDVTCTKCDSSTFLDTGTKNCISDCITYDSYKPRVWGNTTTRVCIKCDVGLNMQGCMLCDNATHCTKCDSQTFLDDGGLYTCLTSCSFSSF